MKKNILIIGSGGREHALGWKLRQSKEVGQIYFAPGNAGTAMIGQNIPIAAVEIEALVTFANEQAIDLTVVGPDDALAVGIVDVFQAKNLLIFGPTKEAAQIESSKAFAKQLMQEVGIPTATYAVFKDVAKAKKYLITQDMPIVIKASGLALGKGVVIANTIDEANKTLDDMMVKKIFAEAGNEVVIEEFLEGEEISIHVFCDGKTAKLFPSSKDHKTIFDGNRGPNTGGMGTISPVPDFGKTFMEEIEQTVIMPLLKGLQKRGITFVGCLYPGIMVTKKGIKVLEFNARFGDPETQSYMRLLNTDLLHILLACVQGNLNTINISWAKKYACCIILAAKGYPGSYQKNDIIAGIDKSNDNTIQIFQAGTKQESNNIVSSGGRVLGVSAIGKSLKSALQSAYKLIDEKRVVFDGMQYRTDIGKTKKITSVSGRVSRKKHTYMTTRLDVMSKIPDARAKVRKESLTKNKSYSVIEDVWIVDSYLIHTTLSHKQLDKISISLAHPLTQNASYEISLSPKIFTYAIEIGFLPGVTDNIGSTTKELIEDALGTSFAPDEGVSTVQTTFILGDISEKNALSVARSLYNPLIQRATIKRFSQFKKDNGMQTPFPKVILTPQTEITTVNLSVPDEELTIIGKQGIANNDGTRRGPLALDLTYMHAIQMYFKKKKRNPTDIELESIAQTWSEHCKHTIFANPIDDIQQGLYKAYIQRSTEEIRQKKGKKDFCVSVFTDNSGGIIFDEKYLITDKVETHNSPSALDPFGGAITGIVGVNRDAIGFGLGAKPIINRYGFCFADPKDTEKIYKDAALTQEMLSPQRIMSGVIEGVNAGGNCSGIPTPQGFVYFDKRYKGKPLVFVGTVGLLPRKVHGKAMHKKGALVGDYIVVVGGRVGQDGIHGATFSSETMDSNSPATAVQIGDPITQKKLSDALIKEARDKGLYNSITDNGAGGLSCSVSEMAKESGGCKVQLDTVPLKYTGLSPWQIWISESQERMTLAIPKNKWNAFFALMQKRGVEATVIGTFTNSGKCIVTHNNKVIMEVDMEFLHNGLSVRAMHTTPQTNIPVETNIPQQKNLTKRIEQMLARPNIASFSFISQQFDHEVQAGSVLKPLQGRGKVNADATITRPLLSSTKGVVLSQSLYPRYSEINAYHMAACAIDTAIRNSIVVGANLDHLALLDNFCWCSPQEPERLRQLQQAALACYDYTVAYGTPFISGKDSMYNDFKGYDQKGNAVKISILPTLLISSIGVIQDSRKAVSLDTKFPGDLLYVLGDTYDEMGGSEYCSLLSEEKTGEKYINNNVPQVDAEKNKKLYRLLSQCIEKQLIASAISIGIGGLGVAIGKTAIGGMLGVEISLASLPGKTQRDDFALFSESQGRILVSVSPQNKELFEHIMGKVSIGFLGKVTDNGTITIRGLHNKTIVQSTVMSWANAYNKTFLGL